MWKVKYLETSAKNNININELFEEIFKLEKKRELDRIAAEDMKMAARKDGLSGLFDIMAREWGRERSEL